jgi:hypothetical protein
MEQVKYRGNYGLREFSEVLAKPESLNSGVHKTTISEVKTEKKTLATPPGLGNDVPSNTVRKILLDNNLDDILNVEGQEISACQTFDEDGYEILEMTVDSGASDTVVNRSHVLIGEVTPSEGSRRGLKYVAASGQAMYNEGEKTVEVESTEGHLCSLKMQVSQVNKPLLSVSKVCDHGHEVVFNKDDGKIVNCKTGQEIKFRREDGVYRLQLRVMKDQSGFQRRGN